MRSLSSPHPETGEGFGSAISSSGNLSFIGAPTEMFYSKLGCWGGKLVHTLVGSQRVGDFTSVSLLGGLTIVGAPLDSYKGVMNAGQSYVFGSKNGTLIEGLASPNAQGNAFYRGCFGSSIAQNGRVLLIGAKGENASSYISACHAYLFRSP